jgi:TonB family protein
MKTFVFRLKAAVMLLLFSSLSLCLAQNDGKAPVTSTYPYDGKAVEASLHLAQQSVDFVASDILVMNESKHAKKELLRDKDKNEFKNVETFPIPENGVELNEVVQGLIDYPQSAIDQGIEGVVKVLCMVAKDGSVSSVVVLEDIGGNCAEAVCRAVKGIKFKPAMQNGYPRRCNLVIPVVFDLTDFE